MLFSKGSRNSRRTENPSPVWRATRVTTSHSTSKITWLAPQATTEKVDSQGQTALGEKKAIPQKRPTKAVGKIPWSAPHKAALQGDPTIHATKDMANLAQKSQDRTRMGPERLGRQRRRTKRQGLLTINALQELIEQNNFEVPDKLKDYFQTDVGTTLQQTYRRSSTRNASYHRGWTDYEQPNKEKGNNGRDSDNQ